MLSSCLAAPTTAGVLPISNSQTPLTVTILKPAGQRRQRLSARGRIDPQNLRLVAPEKVRACINEQQWRLIEPNKSGYQQIPSAEEYIDLLTRIYLTYDKKRDKFMPTQAKIEEYQRQLETRDKSQRDASWRFYTRNTFEYFPILTEHETSHKKVLGLYKSLSKDDVLAFKEARVNGLAEPTDRDLRWEDYASMDKHEKAFFTQAPVTSLEDSYNIILEAHVKAAQIPGDNIHYGRDATFRRITALSCSITKDVVFLFVQNCPGCSSRNKKCAAARAVAIQTQRRRRSMNGGAEPNSMDKNIDANSSFLTDNSQESAQTQVGYAQTANSNVHAFASHQSHPSNQTLNSLCDNGEQSPQDYNISPLGNQNTFETADTQIVNYQDLSHNLNIFTSPGFLDFGTFGSQTSSNQSIDFALTQLPDSGASHLRQMPGNLALSDQQFALDPIPAFNFGPYAGEEGLTLFEWDSYILDCGAN